MSALFLVRSAARQSLPGSPKNSAARAVGVCRWSLLEKIAPGAGPTAAMIERKSVTSQRTVSTGQARSVSSVTSRPSAAAAGRNPCVTESVSLPATM